MWELDIWEQRFFIWLNWKFPLCSHRLVNSLGQDVVLLDCELAGLLGRLASAEVEAQAIDLYALRRFTDDLAAMLKCLTGKCFSYFEELESLDEELLTRHFYSRPSLA